MNNNNDKKIIWNYAYFLESVLDSAEYNISKNGLLEIVDDNFKAVSEYLGRYDDNGERRPFLELRTGTENVLDLFLEKPEEFPNVNIVYAQLPFKNPGNLMRKLALVPAMTPAIAVFGAYGLHSDGFEKRKNLRLLDDFSSELERYGFDFDFVFKQTSKNYYNLVISGEKNKRLK